MVAGLRADAMLRVVDSATLASLTDGLGFEVVQVVAAPKGLDVAVGDPVIHDSVSGTGLAHGDVVLAVGVRPDGQELLALLRDAGPAGVAAVVVKSDALLGTEVVATANDSEVALLVVSNGAEWGQIHAMIRMLTSIGPRGVDDQDTRLGDLSALANAIALRAGASVTIEDARSRVLAYSTRDEPIDEFRRDTILGRRVPDSWVQRLRDDGMFNRIRDVDGPVLVSYSSSEPSYRDRLVMAVRAGGEVVGSIWIQEGDEPLGERHRDLLHEVAPMAALHIVRHLAGDVEQRQEAEVVRSVLTGRMPPSVLSELIDVPVGHEVAVLGLVPDVDGEVASSTHLSRLASVVSLYRRTAQIELVQAPAATTLHVIVSSRNRLSPIVDELVARCRQSVRVPIRVALVRSTDHISGLVEAREDVDAALSVARDLHLGVDQIITFSDVVGHVALDKWRGVSRRHPELLRGRIAELVEHDRLRNTRYVDTLRAYLDRSGDVVSASVDLDVHPNTFRYRLRRAAETASLDVDDPVERLMAHLHLHLLDPVVVSGEDAPDVEGPEE